MEQATVSPNKTEVAKPKPAVEASSVQTKTVGADVCERFRPLVEKYNWDIRIAMAVMQAESGCNPQSYNGTMNTDGTNDAGLFQINSIHDSTNARFDPATNLALAYKVYSQQGWQGWSAYNNGRYLRFLR